MTSESHTVESNAPTSAPVAPPRVEAEVLESDVERSVRLACDPRSEALIREALRVHGRFVEEWIERQNLCPFANDARHRKRIWKWALTQTDADQTQSLLALDALEETAPHRIAMAFLVYPNFAGSLRDFKRFGDRLQSSYAARYGDCREMVGVVFHPDYPADFRTPGTLIQFLRRSPDPFFQYTRRTALDGARQAIPAGPLPTGGYLADPYSEVVENILTDNFGTVTGGDGPERWVRLLADIRADRDASYAALRSR